MEEVLRGNDPVFTPFNVVMMSLAVVVPVLMMWFKNPRGKRAYMATGSVPVLGHALNFGEDKMIEFNEQMTFKALYRTGEPNYEAFVMGTRYLFLGDLAVSLEVLRQRPTVFRRDRGFEGWAKEIGTAKGTFNAEAPHWGRIRRLTAPTFLGNAVHNMISVVAKQTEDLITDLSKQLSESKRQGIKHINGLFPFKRYTAGVIFDLAFGTSIEGSDYATSGQLFSDLMHMMRYIFQRSINPLPVWLFRLVYASFERESQIIMARLRLLIDMIVDMDPTQASSQFLDTLRKASLNDSTSRSSLSPEELKAQIWTFLIGGTETTAVMIESCMYILAQEQYRGLQKQLQAEIDACYGDSSDAALRTMEKLESMPLVTAFVMEIGRLYGPARFLFFELAGVRDVKLTGSDFVIGSGVRALLRYYGFMSHSW
jgi:cytochrome P450